MAKGWCCDECGAWFKGEPRDCVVQDPDNPKRWVRIVAHCSDEGSRITRDLCEDCQRKVFGPFLATWLAEGGEDE